MKNGEIKLTHQKILWVASVMAVLMLLLTIVVPKLFGESLSGLVNPPRNPFLQPEATSIVTLENEESPSASPTHEPTPIPTERYFKDPIMGITGSNLPNGFRVEKWSDNSCGYSVFPQLVEIYGVLISGGSPSYHFNFMDEEKEISDFDVAATGGFIQFPRSVIVERGKYIQVSITFQSKKGNSEWIDHIKYLDKTICSKP